MTDPPDRSAEGFTEAQLRRALDAMGRRLGLDPTGVELLHYRHNATFVLPHARVVARLAGSPAMAHRPAKVVAVARWLAGHGFPTVRLVEAFDQPVEHEGVTATFWHAVEPTGPGPTATDLGGLLRRLHVLAPPGPALPRWDPMDDVRRRLAHAEGLTHDELVFLHARADELDEALAALVSPLGAGVLHGDATVGNLIAGPDGVVMCDFDSTSVGPREWDLIPSVLDHLRFGRPRAGHEAVAAAYGFDVTAWAGFGLLRRVRELKVTTAVVPVLRANPRIADEFRVRLDCLRTGDTTRRWHPYG